LLKVQYGVLYILKLARLKESDTFIDIYKNNLKPVLQETLEVLQAKRQSLSTPIIKVLDVHSGEMALNLVHLLMYMLNYLSRGDEDLNDEDDIVQFTDLMTEIMINYGIAHATIPDHKIELMDINAKASISKLENNCIMIHGGVFIMILKIVSQLFGKVSEPKNRRILIKVMLKLLSPEGNSNLIQKIDRANLRFKDKMKNLHI